MALPQESLFHRVPSSCLVAVVAKSSVLPMESPSGARWVLWWTSAPLSHIPHSLLWTPKEAGAREIPSPTPICTEKRNYGALSPRIKIESHIERKEREKDVYYILYIYRERGRSKKGSQDNNWVSSAEAQPPRLSQQGLAPGFEAADLCSGADA